MGFAGGELLIGFRTVRELGEEVGERRRKGKGPLPFERILGQLGEIAIGGENINVTGVERGNGDGAAPENEVLGIFANLAERENIALADLIEA